MSCLITVAYIRTVSHILLGFGLYNSRANEKISVRSMLVGHFIRYTWLALGWTLFCLPCIDSTSWLKRPSDILIHIDVMASHTFSIFVDFISVMQCPVLPHPNDHLSTVRSSSCSRNQSERKWALWHGVILLKATNREGCHVVKGHIQINLKWARLPE